MSIEDNKPHDAPINTIYTRGSHYQPKRRYSGGKLWVAVAPKRRRRFREIIQNGQLDSVCRSIVDTTKTPTK